MSNFSVNSARRDFSRELAVAELAEVSSGESEWSGVPMFAETLSCVVPVSTPAEAQHGQVGGIYYTDDLLAEPMRLVDGAIEVPTGPGMGIDVDLAKVERYLVRE